LNIPASPGTDAASGMSSPIVPRERIVITGVGLTSPIGNSLPEYRQNLLAGQSGVVPFETRHMGAVLAGVCRFDELR